VARLPPNSIYHKSFDDDDDNDENSDWSPTIESLPTDFDSATDLTFAIGGALKLDLVGDVLDGAAHAEIGIALVAPNITGTFKSSTAPDPCHDPNGALGNSLEVDVGMDLKAYENAKLKFVKAAKAEQTFFATATQVYSTCVRADPATQSTAAG
jgi:hypothetical protein